MFLTLIAFAAQTVFPGGTANDLVAHLSVVTKQNVVFAPSAVAPLGSMEYDSSDLTDISRKLRAKLGVVIAPGVELILNDGFVTQSRIADLPELPQPTWCELAKENLAGGKVTLTTKGKERLDPHTLTEAQFSKPVKVHWFYDTAPVSVCVRDMPEADFLKYVARAVGARFIQSEKEYRLDFDAEEMRRRSTKLLATWLDSRAFKVQWQETEEIDRVGMSRPEERIQMMKTVLEEIPASTLTSAFAKPDGEASNALSLKSKAVAYFLKTRLEKYLTAQPDESEPVMKTPIGSLKASNFVDGTFNYELHLTSKFTLKMEVGAKRQRGNQEFKFNMDYQRIQKGY